MRIGVDARYLSHGLVGGIHTYLSELLPALLAESPNHQFVLFVDTKRPFELEGRCGGAEIHRLPWRSAASTVINDLRLRTILSRHRLDVVHFPANYGVGPRATATVLTVHDALNLEPVKYALVSRHSLSTARRDAQAIYLAWRTHVAVRRADAIVTISRHARDAIAAASNRDAAGITVVPPGAPTGWQRVSSNEALEAVRTRHGLPAAFVLGDALKNPGLTLDAWRRLPEAVTANRGIVFFARTRDLLPIVGDAVASGEARLLIRPSRHELAALFTMAEAFVFPSWIEGFGLPLLEAMACGTPIVASNRGSIPEVAGDAALLADPNDVASFAAHLLAVLSDRQLPAELRRRGFQRLQAYDWRATARQMIRVYEDAVTSRRNRG